MLRYLGTIAPDNGASKNNTNTGTPFAIPPGTTGLRFVASANNMYVRIGREANATAASTLASTTSEYPLGDPTTPGGASQLAPTWKIEPLLQQSGASGAPGSRTVVAVWNGSGGAANVKVYAAIG